MRNPSKEPRSGHFDSDPQLETHHYLPAIRKGRNSSQEMLLLLRILHLLHGCCGTKSCSTGITRAEGKAKSGNVFKDGGRWAKLVADFEQYQ